LNILDIVNAFDSLGEKISEEKLVRKNLKSLPKKFYMKVTTIEEAQDISSMKVDELIGSLQNFEITVNNKTDKKGKGVAFTSSVDSIETQGNHEDDEDMSESSALLGRQFKKILKLFDRMSKPNAQNIRSDINNQPNKEKMTRIHNTKEYNVMNLKVMVTLEENVPLFLRSKRKASQLPGLVMMDLK